ncbi:MAG: serine/threonine-protein kinase [Vicinamibacteria bacterium]
MESLRSSSALPEIGELIDAKYRIESLLGQGGMGAVFRASHAHTGRSVALKVIVPAFAGDETFLRRFEREARAAGSLRHPNIVDVTDFGYATTSRGRLAYLVMEFLDGCSLADVLRQQTGLPLAWSVDILEQVGSAVEEAHRVGLLHRDLKPDNIWLEPNRKGGYTAKVLDFGLAKLATAESGTAPAPVETAVGHASGVPSAEVFDEGETGVRPLSGDLSAPPDQEAPTMARPSPPPGPHTGKVDDADGATAFGAVIGTPAYMSPEQCRGLPLTAASDVYSLGVIAYRMLAGRLPFEGKSDAQIKAHISAAPPDLGVIRRRDLPKDASELVMKTLSKDPSARPRSAGAFASMLSARVQPTSDFLRSALFLFIQHFRDFVEASIFWLSPALTLAAVLSLLGLVEAMGRATILPFLPEMSFAMGPQLLAILGISALQGAIVPSVMQAIVAPLQPVDVRLLRGIFRSRMRSYLRGIAPLVAMMAVYFAWVFAVVLLLPHALESVRPFLRTLPRPIAIVAILALVLPVTLGPMILFRRSKLGSGFQFLGAIAMMEGKFGRPALQRSQQLSKASGRALQAIFLVSIGLGGMFGLSLGFLSAAIPRGLPEWAPGAILAPLMVIGMVFLAPGLSVVSALTYLRALKAAGESPDEVLLQFELEILPASHWKLATRERILTQIDATRT